MSFPAAVKDDMGNALAIAQFGGIAPTAKPWKGLGPDYGKTTQCISADHAWVQERV
jgi:hypothetical protein